MDLVLLLDRSLEWLVLRDLCLDDDLRLDRRAFGRDLDDRDDSLDEDDLLLRTLGVRDRLRFDFGVKDLERDLDVEDERLRA